MKKSHKITMNECGSSIKSVTLTEGWESELTGPCHGEFYSLPPFCKGFVLEKRMTMPWFRLYGRTVDDEKLRLLAFEDRWHFIAILCLKSQGVLEDKNKKLMVRKIAIKLGLSVAELDEVKRRLMEVQLIDEKYEPKRWNDCQFISDNSTSRVRKHRENKKKEQCNGDETLQERFGNGPDTDTDTDTDTELNHNSENSERVSTRCPTKKIVDLYHKTLPTLPKVEKLTDTRKSYIRQRWREDLKDLEQWENYFNFVGKSDFLMGRVEQRDGRRPFIASLEWLTRPSNFAKVAEDRYHG